MQFSSSFIALAVASLQVLPTAAAYNADVDGCRPLDSSYKGAASKDYLVCTVSQSARPWTRFDCGNRGYIVYDYQKNNFRVNSDTFQANRLTFHAECIETKNKIARQVDHADLSTPPPSASTWSRYYNGMNKGPCNIEDPTLSVHFYSYTLSPTEYNPGCTKTPVHPIKP